MPSTGSTWPGSRSKVQLRQSCSGPQIPIDSAGSSPSSRRTIMVRLAHGHPRATTSRYRPASTGQPSRPSAVIRASRYLVSRTNSPAALTLPTLPHCSRFQIPTPFGPRPRSGSVPVPAPVRSPSPLPVRSPLRSGPRPRSGPVPVPAHPSHLANATHHPYRKPHQPRKPQAEFNECDCLPDLSGREPHSLTKSVFERFVDLGRRVCVTMNVDAIGVAGCLGSGGTPRT